MRNPKTDFYTEISVFGFSFLLFDWEIRKRIWKTVLKNSTWSCTRTHNWQKVDRCSRDQFCRSVFGFLNRTVKRKSMKSGLGFPNWNPPWGRIHQRRNPFSDFSFYCKIRNPEFQNLDPDFPIERNSRRANTRTSTSARTSTRLTYQILLHWSRSA